MSLGDKLQITPELLTMIETMAYNGLTQSDIADVLKRDRNTIFYNAQDKDKSIISAYKQGKSDNKAKLLEKMEGLTVANSEEVQFKAVKYALNVKHKVIEQNKAELSGADGQPLIPNSIVIKGLEPDDNNSLSQ
jgi:transcriptional regulator with XRE-family HTH domain